MVTSGTLPFSVGYFLTKFRILYDLDSRNSSVEFLIYTHINNECSHVLLALANLEVDANYGTLPLLADCYTCHCHFAL